MNRFWLISPWLIVLIAISCGSVRADFIDDFEGPTLDPFWQVRETAGTITFPSSTLVHGGSQSVRFDSTFDMGDKWLILSHDFAEPIYGEASVWFYDTGADVASSNYLYLKVENSSLGLDSNLVAFDYDLGPSNGGSYYIKPFGGTSSTNTGVDRTQAWHQYTIMLETTSCCSPSMEIRSIPGQEVFRLIAWNSACSVQPGVRPGRDTLTTSV